MFGPMGDTPKKPDPMVQSNFRLPQSLLDRVDSHARRIEEATPGITCSRVDALKALLIYALQKLEPPRK